MSTLEKLTNERGRMLAEVKVEGKVTTIKDSFLEIKELLQDIKKSDIMSRGGDNSVNNENKKE